jgi:hypothetical protein
MLKRAAVIVMLCLSVPVLQAQEEQVMEESFMHRFLTPSDTFNRQRLTLVLGTETALYSGAVYALYQYWYKDFDTEPFHFFNDNAEWLQMDKAGHLYTAYFENNLATELYLWTGMEKKKAYWSGFATASLFQLTIELFDAYSAKWGFSPGDFAFNTLGAGLSTAQFLMWDEQRIRVKFSQRFPSYDGFDPIVQARASSLYGSSGPERLIKDYNGLTTWLSVNPYPFLKQDTRWPRWLMVSAGYGAHGMFGGFDNYWCEDAAVSPEDCSPESLIDYRNDIERIRQYYLSFDIDLTAIETNSPFWNMMFEVLSIVKIPMPTLEYNSDGRLNFYPLYF